MDLEAVYLHLTRKKGAVEEFPFGPQALVFKVCGKMFAIVAPDALPPYVTLKGDPAEAVALRERHPSIRPGYHLNKRHWSTVTLNGTVPSDVLRALLDQSYDLVVQGLARADREALKTA